MPRLGVAISILILILTFSLVSSKALAEEVELGYDNLTATGWNAPTGALYYSVLFSPPSTPWTVNKIKVAIDGASKGNMSTELKYEIWDKNKNTLYEDKVDFKDLYLFSVHRGRWNVFSVPNVTVTRDFYVSILNPGVVQAPSGKAVMIFIGEDNTTTNKGSYYFNESRGELKGKPAGNWIIRVVGSTLPPPTITPAPTTPAPTTTQPPTTTPAPTTSVPITQAETPTPAKGICGPAAIVLAALLPLVGYSLLTKSRR